MCSIDEPHDQRELLSIAEDSAYSLLECCRIRRRRSRLFCGGKLFSSRSIFDFIVRLV